MTLVNNSGSVASTRHNIPLHSDNTHWSTLRQELGRITLRIITQVSLVNNSENVPHKKKAILIIMVLHSVTSVTEA